MMQDNAFNSSRRAWCALFACAALLSGCATAPVQTATSPGAVSTPSTVTFQVDGMACANCAAHVVEALNAVPGVKSAQVNFETKTATVAVDPNKPASTKDLYAAVAQWRKEHFGESEDPNCLNPERRKELQKQGG